MKNIYLKPEVVVVEFQVEHGFALSGIADPIEDLVNEVELFNTASQDKSVEGYGVSQGNYWGGSYTGSGWNTEGNHFWE